MQSKLRVLYAEDNAADADLAKTHFELNAPEFDLETASTAEQCMALLKGGDYDALLLDNHLPDSDGATVLKDLESQQISLPVVIVTGSGDEGLVVQLLRLGAWDYVPKQGNYLRNLPAVLRTAIVEFRARAQERAAGRLQRRILLVEHTAADVDLTMRHFAERAAQFNLDVAGSSNEALALLRQVNFDLVLADLRMPDIDALELLRKTKHEGIHVPFIILTGQGDEAAAAAALKLGAYDYFVKRENYLFQLPLAIENAIARWQLAESNRRLEQELGERQRAEGENARLLAEVLGQRQRLDEIISSVPGVVWESWGPPGDPAETAAFVSHYVKQMLGYSEEEWLSTPHFWLNIMHAEDRERAARERAEFFARGRGGISQFRWIGKDGRVVCVEARSTITCDEHGHAAGTRGVAMDVTASKEAEEARAQLEEQLRQAQKMESIGRLAGGVAHDFNNLLTIITGYAQMMHQELQPGDPLRVYLDEIKRAGEMASDLTGRLLAISRRQRLQPRVIELNSLIIDSVRMLQRVLGENIEVITKLGADAGQVKIDAGQMHQVILNVAMNARDAMPRGGKLTVETQKVVFDEHYAQKYLSVEPGSYVMLAISDTGVGMDAETLSHIFEPFFTTKEQGKGTGLGLSTAYGIIQQSGGSIWPYSEPGRGTTIKIYLPQIAEPVTVVEEKRPVESARGSETVLVVEDEDMVRKLACEALRKYGYQVIEAANGGEALLACEQHDGPIALMITDVIMPQMSGGELAGRLRQLRPEMRVLYMSGYSDEAIVRQGFLDPAMFFLQKPFVPSTLAQKVRDVLDQPATSTPSP